VHSLPRSVNAPKVEAMEPMQVLAERIVVGTSKGAPPNEAKWIRIGTCVVKFGNNYWWLVRVALIRGHIDVSTNEYVVCWIANTSIDEITTA
jgi:hypothetical protein